MQCPKCRKGMTQVEHKGVVVDRCDGCSGLWFDRLEREELRELEGAGRVDTGSARVGAENDHKRVYDCPRCGKEMERRTSLSGGMLFYERCKGCKGVYMDAGEFRAESRSLLVNKYRTLLTRNP